MPGWLPAQPLDEAGFGALLLGASEQPPRRVGVGRGLHHMGALAGTWSAIGC